MDGGALQTAWPSSSQRWLRSAPDPARGALVMRPPYWPSSETPKSPATTACRPSRHWRKRMRRLSGLSNATPLAMRSAGRSSWSKQGEAGRSNLAGVWSPYPALSRPPRRGRPVEHSAHNRHRFYCVICSAGSRGKEGKDLSRGKEGKDLTHEYFQLRECQVADRYVDITRGTCLCS